MKCNFIKPEITVTDNRLHVKETDKRTENVKHVSLTSSATAMQFLSELSYILVPFCSAVQTQP